MGKLRYSEFRDQIDIDQFEAAIGFAPIHTDQGNDIGHCIFPENHSHGDTTGKFAIHRDKQVYNCWVCFPGDTPVRTIDGFKPIQDISTRDRVLADDGFYLNVHRTTRRSYNSNLIRIHSPALSNILAVTPEHPFKTCRDGQFVWTIADDLKVGDHLVVQQPTVRRIVTDIEVPEQYLTKRKFGPMRRGPREFEVTPEFLWMIGMYLAEGHAQERCIGFSLHRDEIEYQRRLKDLFEGYGYSVTIKAPDNRPNSSWVMVHSSVLSEWFPEWLGHGCDRKRIPPELLDLKDEQAAALVQGLMDGDGHIERDCLTTTSRTLAMQMVTYRVRDNGFPSVSCSFPPGKRPVYRIENVVGRLPRRSEYPRNQARHDEVYLSRITKIEHDHYEGSVYNLSVERNPTYTVDNVAVHNCGGGSLLSLAMELYDFDVDEATQWLYQFTTGLDTRSDQEFQDYLLEMLEDIEERVDTMPYFNQRVLERFDGSTDYFRDRGISDEIITKYNLRYHDWTMKPAPIKQGKDGPEKIDEDYYGPTAIFPHYWQGRLVGWQHRWMEWDEEHTKTPRWLAKYTNTTDFPKQSTLFNYDEALKATEPVVVCESVPTVLFLASFGIPAVSFFGSKPTPAQLRLLRRFTQGVILAPDNDKTGDTLVSTATKYLERYINVWVADKVNLGPKADLGDYAKTSNPYGYLCDHLECRVHLTGIDI